MDPAEKCRETESIVLEWQGPVYGLARRVLGNEADAADATQEIFLNVFRKLEAFDRTRPLKPWILRVAANHLQNCIRARATRRRREADAMPVEDDRSPEDALEKVELARQLEAQLAKLEPADRLLLLLHYSSELPQTEIASALSLPRSTVQTRLQHALDRLRKGMAGALTVLAASSLEAALRDLPLPPVPPQLTSAILMNSSASSVLAAGGKSLLVGGSLMSQKIIAAVVVCGALVGSGYWIGQEGRQRAQAAAEREAQLARATQTRLENLEAKHRKAETELADLRAARDREAEAQAKARKAAGESAATATVSGRENPAGTDIDWSKFSDLIATHLDLLVKAHGETTLTPEEQNRLLELHLEMSKVIGAMRKLADRPLFDEQLLPNFLDALMSKTLDLTDEQRSDVRGRLESFLSSRVKDFDFDDSLPSEVYALRRDLLSSLEGAAREVLSPDQQDPWGQLRHVLGGVLEGDRTLDVLPIGQEGESQTAERHIADEWRKAFGLAEEQGAAASAAASDFTHQAHEMLSAYGQLDEPRRELSTESQAELRQKLLELQIQVERQLKQVLTPQQTTALQNAAPTIFRFTSGGEASSDIRRGSPL
ncbi:MAG TPA: sigma-70 family RNA polymerase sigma factor [Planctomycetota bacterium]|nr:sigma-70 family RNA polymerase sigma factor [Planctomycetota bacterium]